MIKIASYNINGIRSALRKGLDVWLETSKTDIICLQEIKANKSQFDVDTFKKIGYYSFIHSAQKAGYSGVAILSKIKPINVEYGCGIKEIDFEGRIIRADYKNFSILSVYFPSGTNPLRQGFKMKFLYQFLEYIVSLNKDIPNLIVSGDFNICHKSIDIHNPLRNKNTSGFLPEERQWISDFLDNGFIDTFRYFNKTPHNYSWWSYRARCREKNLGWRIDYNFVSSSMLRNLSKADILSDVVHSDHCPVTLELTD